MKLENTGFKISNTFLMPEGKRNENPEPEITGEQPRNGGSMVTISNFFSEFRNGVLKRNKFRSLLCHNGRSTKVDGENT